MQPGLFLRPLLAVFCVAGLCAVASVGADETPSPVGDPAESWRLEAVEWKADLSPEVSRIAIVNHHGNLQVRGAEEGKVEVVGHRQRHADDPRLPDVLLERRDGEMTVEVRYPPEEAGFKAPDTWRKRRIDITVYVPKTLPLRVETLHGRALVKGYAGDIDAVSESGPVQIVTSGAVSARSNHGDVFARLHSSEWGRPQVLESQTGELRVEVPWGAEFKASLETQGEITSDFSMDLDWPPGGRLKKARVEAGAGHGEIQMTSGRGHLKLIRRPQAAGPSTLGKADS